MLQQKPKPGGHGHDECRSWNRPEVAAHGLNDCVGHLAAGRRQDQKSHALADDQRTQAHGERLQAEIGDQEAVQASDGSADDEDRSKVPGGSEASGAGRHHHVADRNDARPGQIQLAAQYDDGKAACRQREDDRVVQKIADPKCRQCRWFVHGIDARHDAEQNEGGCAAARGDAPDLGELRSGCHAWACGFARRVLPPEWPDARARMRSCDSSARASSPMVAPR